MRTRTHALPVGSRRGNASQEHRDPRMLAICLHGDTATRKQAPEQALRETRHLGVGPPANHPTPCISAGHRPVCRRKHAVPRSTLQGRKRCDQGKCNFVSKGGLEPPRPFGHQPLKLARLPISPLRRGPPNRERHTLARPTDRRLTVPPSSRHTAGTCSTVRRRASSLSDRRRSA